MSPETRGFDWLTGETLNQPFPYSTNKGLPNVRELANHEESVSAVGFSCDGTMAATVRPSVLVTPPLLLQRVLEAFVLTNAQPHHTLSIPPILLQGAYSGKLMVWDAKTQALIRTLEGPEDVEWLDWHSKGGWVG